MANNKSNSKAIFVTFLVIGIVLMLAGFGLMLSMIGIIPSLENPEQITDYIYLPILGMCLFMVGGISLAISMRERIVSFWRGVGMQVHFSKEPESKNEGTVCPRCECVNDRDALYCKKCGEKLR